MRKPLLIFAGLLCLGWAVEVQPAFTSWEEQKNASLTRITPGIPAYGKTDLQDQRDEKKKLRVLLGEPVVISVAHKEEKGPFFNSQACTGVRTMRW